MTKEQHDKYVALQAKHDAFKMLWNQLDIFTKQMDSSIDRIDITLHWTGHDFSGAAVAGGTIPLKHTPYREYKFDSPALVEELKATFENEMQRISAKLVSLEKEMDEL